MKRLATIGVAIPIGRSSAAGKQKASPFQQRIAHYSFLIANF
jgi:hypothetical protein